MVCCIQYTKVTCSTSCRDRIIRAHPSLQSIKEIIHSELKINHEGESAYDKKSRHYAPRSFKQTRSIASMAEPIFVVAKGTQKGFIFLYEIRKASMASLKTCLMHKRTKQSINQYHMVLAPSWLHLTANSIHKTTRCHNFLRCYDASTYNKIKLLNVTKVNLSQVLNLNMEVSQR